MATNSSPSSHGCETDCQVIHDAPGRLTTNLVLTLANRTKIERRQIRETYMTMYGEDLLDRLQKAQVADQNYEICNILSKWMLEPHDRDAIVARGALEHGDTIYKALVEIYAGRKSSELLRIKQAYQARFKRQLDQDIGNDPPHSYQRILVALATAHKSHHADVSQHVAKCDAKRLYEAGEGRLGAIDESVVLEILHKRSIPQLRLTFYSYKHIYGHDYIKALKKDCYGEFGDSLRAVVKCMYTPPKYYSKMLYASIKGTTTDKGALARVMVSRAEIDIVEIQRTFQNKYGVSLSQAISESLPNGDYKNFLISLANTPLPTC